jgi:hypothetical protein
MNPKRNRYALAMAVVSSMLTGFAGGYEAAAQPVDGKLGVNIAGGNWINPYTGPSLIEGVKRSGARWVFVTAVWHTFEYTPPTAPCPALDGTADGDFYYFSSGPSGLCRHYRRPDVEAMDRVIGGLKANGHYLAMGQWSAPTWASGAPEACPGNKKECAKVYRDHLAAFSDGARDLARFLVTRYSPAAFSVWNEPNGEAYLSIEPDQARMFWRGAWNWPAWQDYVTYLLQPIATDLRAVAPGVMIMGPELASSFNGDGDSNTWSAAGSRTGPTTSCATTRRWSIAGRCTATAAARATRTPRSAPRGTRCCSSVRRSSSG